MRASTSRDEGMDLTQKPRNGLQEPCRSGFAT